MSAEDKARSKAQVAKGKVKEAVGEATGNEQWEVEGKADKVEGNLRQAGEKVKDAFKR
ncbi:MAG: CsbD family protein [Acidimicrobiales bacterium]